jgi:hypothetical protein
MTGAPATHAPVSNPDDRAEALTDLAQRLTGLLALDCQAFEAHRPHEAAERSEETGRLANLYRHESARIRADLSLIRGATPERRRRLATAIEALDAVLARHGRAIHAAKTVSEGLVHAIAQEVARQRGAVAGSYGPGGSSSPVSTATAITLNRRA